MDAFLLGHGVHTTNFCIPPFHLDHSGLWWCKEYIQANQDNYIQKTNQYGKR